MTRKIRKLQRKLQFLTAIHMKTLETLNTPSISSQTKRRNTCKKSLLTETESSTMLRTLMSTKELESKYSQIFLIILL